MIAFEGMRHIALKVSDVERSARFYECAFGMRRFAGKYNGAFVALVSPGLRDQISLSTEEVGETGGATARAGAPGGIDHFGFILSPGSNLEQAVARMKACGAEYLRHHDIARGVPSAFFRDPDGYTFQIIKFPRLTRAYIALLPVLHWLGR